MGASVSSNDWTRHGATCFGPADGRKRAANSRPQQSASASDSREPRLPRRLSLSTRCPQQLYALMPSLTLQPFSAWCEWIAGFKAPIRIAFGYCISGGGSHADLWRSPSSIRIQRCSLIGVLVAYNILNQKGLFYFLDFLACGSWRAHAHAKSRERRASKI